MLKPTWLKREAGKIALQLLQTSYTSRPMLTRLKQDMRRWTIYGLSSLKTLPSSPSTGKSKSRYSQAVPKILSARTLMRWREIASSWLIDRVLSPRPSGSLSTKTPTSSLASTKRRRTKWSFVSQRQLIWLTHQADSCPPLLWSSYMTATSRQIFLECHPSRDQDPGISLLMTSEAELHPSLMSILSSNKQCC